MARRGSDAERGSAQDLPERGEGSIQRNVMDRHVCVTQPLTQQQPGLARTGLHACAWQLPRGHALPHQHTAWSAHAALAHGPHRLPGSQPPPPPFHFSLIPHSLTSLFGPCQIFNLKFLAKQLGRAAVKSEKEEKAEKIKVREEGTKEGEPGREETLGEDQRHSTHLTHLPSLTFPPPLRRSRRRSRRATRRAPRSMRRMPSEKSKNA